jgi:hypothetical protein
LLARIRQYLKYYLEKPFKELRQEAMASAHEYYKGKGVSAIEFTAYQQGYIRAYRETYAKAMMEQYSSATLNVAHRLTN